MKQINSWDGVTIQKYYDLLEVINLPLSDEDKAIAMLSALSEMDIDYITGKLDIKDLAKAISDLKFIGDTKAVGTVKPTLKVGKRKFSFDLMLKEGAASSFISLSEYTKTAESSKKNIHNIIAIFCYELNWWGVRKKRTVQSQKGIAEYLKEHMTMNDAFVYRDFFLLSYKTLLASTKDYLDSEQRKIMKKLNKLTSQPL
jgi:hypothetical protein